MVGRNRLDATKVVVRVLCAGGEGYNHTAKVLLGNNSRLRNLGGGCHRNKAFPARKLSVTSTMLCHVN